jgi:hypothetical protein
LELLLKGRYRGEKQWKSGQGLSAEVRGYSLLVLERIVGIDSRSPEA